MPEITPQGIAKMHLENALTAYNTLTETDERFRGMVFLLENMLGEADRIRDEGKAQ